MTLQLDGQLAVNGGPAFRQKPFPRFNGIGEEEKRAAIEVIESGNLSQFLGSWSPDFLGGPKVRAFEEAWARQFGVKHAISFNSATSALYAAVGACGFGPGDEVIVTPSSMVATATGILTYNAVPVFSDIEDRTFNLDPGVIEKAITPRTRGIMLTHLWGHPANMSHMMQIAKKHGLLVIEDNAQSPLATVDGTYAGAVGDIGIFSLNYHKHIHTGEGGIAVTNSDDLASRLQLIRNHGEAVVAEMGFTGPIENTFGNNYRLTELQAAIGLEQLKKLGDRVAVRQREAAYLTRYLSEYPCFSLPMPLPSCEHVYYCYMVRYHEDVFGVPRERLVAALQAEGLPWSAGYLRPIYWLPMYQQRAVYPRGCPFTCSHYDGANVSYEYGICPVAERVHTREIMGIELCMFDLAPSDLEDIVRGTAKVLGKIRELA
jgi:perosamine synthetase